jgi:gephyrin
MVSMDAAWGLVENVALTIASQWDEAGPEYVDWDHEAVQSGTAVLAEDVLAPWPLPRFDAALKDGYAVRSADLALNQTLLCKGLAVAGKTTEALGESLSPGTCVYITTGAPLPPGADAVIPVENVRLVSDTTPTDSLILDENDFHPFHIQLQGTRAVPTGHEVRRRGHDVALDQVILRRGQRLGSVERSVLCSFGVQRRIPIRRLPRVAVLSTGSELVEASSIAPSSLPSGSIYDSNRPLLLSLLRRYVPMSHIRDGGIAADHQVCGKLKELLEDPQLDVVIISGGVSMGLSDVVKPLLAELGVIHFGRLCMKPGKPMTFASHDKGSNRPWMAFALPGNPVSSSVCFALLVVPALQLVSGVLPIERAYPRRLVVRLAEEATPDAERPEFQRAQLIQAGTITEADRTRDNAMFPKGTMAMAGVPEYTSAGDAQQYPPLALITGSQSSTRLQSMIDADVLVYLPAGKDPLPAGTPLYAFLLET